jgi:hypothetical protein
MDSVRFRQRLRSAAVLALVGFVCLASATSLQAQTTNASVAGTVQDSQGGVLPGATVTLTSRATAAVLTATTDAQGRFVFAVVRPGTYTLQASMQGFKTLERSNLVLSANDRFSAGALTLEVGEMSESISVVARVSELQAESGERSFTLESEAIKNIANNGRSLFGFVTLVPGIVPNSGTENPTSAEQFTVNGMRHTQNNVTIDGITNIDTGNNGSYMASTNLDAMEEFKVLTNSYQAEFGRAAGAQIQMVTKSGSQEFHGSGYWYGRRSGWDAVSWTNNRAGAEPADSSRNDYGYTIGGPIYIPGAFNTDKKKLFFFWSQEWQKRTDPVGERLSRVPTALEREGNFSQSRDNNGNIYPYIRDWTTGLPCSASNTSGCFQYNGVVGWIPPNRLYQPGMNALNVYPDPNYEEAGGIHNYRSQAPDTVPRREELLRLDFQPTDNWRFTGRYMRNKDLQERPYGTTWAGTGSNNLDDTGTTFDNPGYNWVISATGVLNNTTSLEISVGSAHNSLTFDLGNTDLRRAAAGLNDMPLLYPDAVQQDYIPDMIFNGGHVTGDAGRYQTNNGPFLNENTTYDILANLTKVFGAHTAKFGVYYQSSYKPQTAFTAFNSTIDFRDNVNNPYDTQFSYANAAIGAFTNYTQANKFPFPEWVYDNYEWYLQDNWKATSKLTLDFGVRFYYLTPQWDQSMQVSTFIPDDFDFANAAQLYYPAMVNGQRVGIDPATGQTVEARFIGRLTPGSNRFNGTYNAGEGISDTMQSGNAFKVSPRFGFVFDLSENATAILRGGAGIFYDRPMGNLYFDQSGNAPATLVSSLDYGLLTQLGSAGGDPFTTLSLAPTEYEFAPPRVIAWNLGFQKKLWKSLVFDLAYVGSKSDDLVTKEQLNDVPVGAAWLPENQDPTTGGVLSTDFMRPYQGYNNINQYNYKGFSNYHSLQTSLMRRFDNGIMVSAFYVWSKSLGINDDDYANIRPNVSEEENRRINYSYTSRDRTHNFVINFVYQTPKIAEGAAGVFLNDWQISGIYRWLSGTPYAVNFSVPGVNSQTLSGSPNVNGRVVVVCDPGSGSSSDPYAQLNTGCFAPPQVGSIGDESARYFVHGPGLNNLDLSLSKSFVVKDRIRLEVRVDAFNALNHTQFSGVNNSVSFASLSDPTVTNLPYDASGNLVRQTGFGTINGVRPPRTIQLVTRLTF